MKLKAALAGKVPTAGVVVSEHLFVELKTAGEIVEAEEAVQFVGQPSAKFKLGKHRLKGSGYPVAIQSEMNRDDLDPDGDASFEIV